MKSSLSKVDQDDTMCHSNCVMRQVIAFFERQIGLAFVQWVLSDSKLGERNWEFGKDGLKFGDKGIREIGLGIKIKFLLHFDRSR